MAASRVLPQMLPLLRGQGPWCAWVREDNAQLVYARWTTQALSAWSSSAELATLELYERDSKVLVTSRIVDGLLAIDATKARCVQDLRTHSSNWSCR
jgi:hypothetical protein